LNFKNGNIYEGDVLNGMLHGQGSLLWTDGVKYTGEFQFNKVTGEGSYCWPDGSVYTGQVLDSLRSGQGVFTQNGVVYDGFWSNGLRHGSGTLKHPSGTCYKGEFFNGFKQGKGRIDYPNGNYYEGEWSRDQKNGFGTMFWKTRMEKYTGNWANNLQNGFGTHLWLEERGEGKFLRNRYEGFWVNGLREGVGVFYYANGTKYEGEWKDNLKHGFAKFIEETGDVKYCQFLNDKNPQQQAMMLENAKELVNMTNSIVLDNSREEMEEGKREKEETIIEKSLMIEIVEAQSIHKSDMGNESPTRSPKNLNDSLVKSPKRGGSPKKKKDPQDSPNKIVKKQIVEANPFYKMIDLADLFKDLGNNEAVIAFVMKNVTNMLLRHNPSLKKIYKFYAGIKMPGEEEDFENEIHFAMNYQKFWKMLRDIKITTPKASLGFINRLILQGKKTSYELLNSEGFLEKSLDLIKNNENYRNYSNEELVHYNISRLFS